MSKYYSEYGQMLRQRFGGRVQKISIDTGAICPNRDGTLATGGCIYCTNASFVPDYAQRAGADVVRQLEDGKRFFAHKYPDMRYLAYFQANTSTHAEASRFRAQVEAAMTVPDVAGVVVGTRPDCMPQDVLRFLADINANRMPVMVEYGAESTHNDTLLLINRCHTWQQTVDAVQRTAEAGIDCGLHLIMGLPGEDRTRMMESVQRINALPVHSVKFHQLQILRNTRLARLWQEGSIQVTPFELDDYVSLCADIVDALRPDIVIDRFTSQSPPHMLLAPRWDIKNYQFTALLQRELDRRHASDKAAEAE